MNSIIIEEQKELSIMATRTGHAIWEGTLKDGKGTMKLGSGAFEGPYSLLHGLKMGRERILRS